MCSARRERRGGGGSVTSERTRMRMTERQRREKKKNPLPQNNKMAGSRADERALLPCLTPSACRRVSERAGRRRDGLRRRGRGRS